MRLREKGGKRHGMPCHHHLEEYVTAYLDGAGLRTVQKEGCSVRSGGARASSTSRGAAGERLAIIGRLAAAHGIGTKLGNHSFRSTGVNAYLKNGASFEKAAAIANHASMIAAAMRLAS